LFDVSEPLKIGMRNDVEQQLTFNRDETVDGIVDDLVFIQMFVNLMNAVKLTFRVDVSSLSKDDSPKGLYAPAVSESE